MYEEDGSGAGRSLVAFRDGWGRTISVVRKDDHHDRSLTADQATRSATRRLQIGLAVASAVFTVGTALHNFAVIDTALIEQTASLTSEHRLAPSMVRNYQTELRLFSHHLTDTRYGWAAVCEVGVGESRNSRYR
ncbi:hypothetical protein E1264_12830 [Actinomadura sp. KC216]|uniref:hypothetical protein n=1 Tax=Actinomadura sp. KC216 TaxID=2530370 RepID=UPI00104B9A28|nr:hypothetical protein [Actinomadura sp. KC216]TDB88005.1 hypothetical protein E1264_12830 [Actinomadura sp. KC216]